MAFWVYVLKCADGSYYTGHTDNFEARLGQHAAGQGGDYTRRRLPVALAYSDYFEDRDSAFHAEHRIKNWSRAKKEALFVRDWDRLSHFARPPSERPASLDFARDERTRGETQVDAGQHPKPLIPIEVEGRTSLDFAPHERDRRIAELELSPAQPSQTPLIPSEVEGRTASLAHPQRPCP